MPFELISNLVLQVFIPLTLLVGAGGMWPRWFPDTSAAQLRLILNRLGLYLFVPALMFSIAASAEITPQLLAVPVLMGSSILLMTGLLYLVFYHTPVRHRCSPQTRAVFILSGAFGNIMFVGLPVLTFLFGPRGAQYPAFADVMAGTPLVWTLGIWVATRLGAAEGSERPPFFSTLFSLPPFWAFVLGVSANLLGWNPEWLIRATHFVGQPTVPVMMMLLGAAIPWHKLRPSLSVMLMALVKLVLFPLLTLLLASLFYPGRSEPIVAVILEAAMPSMVVVLVIAERFKLDIATAGLLTGWSTVLMWLTLPMWILFLR